MEIQKLTGNEPATPTIEQDGQNLQLWNTVSGLTIRQQFAQSAMKGILSNAEWGKTIVNDWDEFKQRAAEASVEMADALINELNKTEKQ